MNFGLHKSKGTLLYGIDDKPKLIVKIDPDIYFFYRNLIPKSNSYNPQKYSPHISVVRNESPLNMEHWGKYEKKEIEFLYNSNVQKGEKYIWLNVYSLELEKIRNELGLRNDLYEKTHPSYIKTFHITLGNIK
ncbi:MAG: hypothetical protein EKK64_10430 [Neisseriaceae bacterium]|nr:MAG: hypothetical protein EKK64_10430 [Neisseriaceae bacterium]